LLGDSTLLTVSNQLTQALGSAVGASTASYRSLSDLGVQIQVDGTLSLNTTKLDAALASNPTQAAAVFSGTTGVGKTLNTLLNGLLNSGGIFDSRTQSLAHQSDTLDQAQIDLDRRLANEQSMYQAQFTALDTLLSSLKSTSNFLTQQMAAFSPSSR
jgi:flagellar hook-associated protein 2